jgi:L-aspartate oxidase
MISTPDDGPVVVVGSGIAGGLLALAAAEVGPVVMITKEALGDGSTRRAQGGIAAAIDGHDSIEAHIADTLAAGAGLCDREAVTRICREGPGQIAALLARGVDFDRRDGRLRLAREGAHSAARVVHAGGDATGAHIVGALGIALRIDPRIELAEDERALEVLVGGGRVMGLRSRDGAGRERVRPARAVVLAAGGMGQLYTRTTNPLGATADGPALAGRAGAALADLELIQFHPTALALGDGPLALVSEAVRGEGAILRDAAGYRFMPDEHPMAELGPRDVVARAIARHAAELGADVTLDLRHLGADAVRRRFPTVAALCAEHGLDLARDLIPVTPAAHYAIGGALTDMAGRTTLPGLFAIGECAATGAHGANRLASNGLLEAAVLAAGAAEALAGDLDDWPDGPVAHARHVPTATGRAPGARRALQTAMWRGVGVERDAEGLAEAARDLARVVEGGDPATDNLLLVARLAAAAAALRTESRGAHFRRDHPAADPRQARRIAWVGDEPFFLPSATARRPRTLAMEAA